MPPLLAASTPDPDFWDGANVTLLIAFLGTIIVPLLNEVWKRFLDHGAFKRQKRREAVERLQQAARLVMKHAPGERHENAEKLADALDLLKEATLTMDLGWGSKRNFAFQSLLMTARTPIYTADPAGKFWISHYGAFYELDRVILWPLGYKKVGLDIVAEVRRSIESWTPEPPSRDRRV